MAAYLVADVEVTDPAQFEAYRSGLLSAALAAYGTSAVIVDGL
jgi:uncharacterized protein (DUF1330 family)